VDWDHLRVFLALARAGSVAASSEALGVSRSTVTRRLEALERDAGLKLVERGLDGARLTEAGESLVPHAERVEEEVLAAERLLTGKDFRLSGRLEVSVFEIGGLLLAPAFVALRQEHPDIEVVLRSTDRVASLHRRETDLAIRAAVEPPSGDLFGRRLGRLEYGVYGRPEVTARANPAWILWDESRGAHGTWALAERLGKPLHVAARVDSVTAMLELAVAGMGVALLPVALAAHYPDLVARGRVPRRGQGIDVWALTHPDLKRAARVRAALTTLGGMATRLLDTAP